MRYWEIIADNLSKAGWSLGCVSTINSNERTIFVADAHRDNHPRPTLAKPILHAAARQA
jgi:hypothetical protein